MAILLHSLSLQPPNPKPQNPNRTRILSQLDPSATLKNPTFRRDVVLRTASLCFVSIIFQNPLPESLADPSKSPKPGRLGIANTKSWFQFFGDGFSIRVPPQYVDIMEPEDYSAGLSLYGDKAKPKTFGARFASPDGSEVLSVVIRPSNSLKITFLEAKDISELGSLKEAARIFVPGAATIYSARTIKVKEDEGFRNYYLYEFGRDEERIALVAAVSRGRVSAANSDYCLTFIVPDSYDSLNHLFRLCFFLILEKVFIAGAAAPESKWKEDELKLRSAAISLTVQ